jgi:endoglucanase
MQNNITRRYFIKTSLAGAAALVNVPTKNLFEAQQNSIPRWRGFNLLDYFSPFAGPHDESYRTTEDDFRWMSDWGFDFVRLPMAYPRWIKFDRSKPIRPVDLYNIDEHVLVEIDQLVALAQKYGLHVSLNFHRAPGYCVNAGFNEPFDLWKDQAALDAFCFHWSMFAKRYKDIAANKISFDLVNEPSVREDMNEQHSKRSAVPGDVYRRVAQAAARVIREVNPDFIVIADGNNVGNDVIPEIMDLGVVQSCRGYYPAIVSHYRAPWVYKMTDDLPAPVWPGKIGDEEWGRARLEKYYAPWIELTQKGVGVHCGECGCWNRTPHQVFLSWFGDVLDILTENGIGYAIWNFRGEFGVLDSGRRDVEYEDWHGHKLDRKMLDLLLGH